MDIKYLGHSSFYIKGKQAVVVTDPYNPDVVGIKFPKHVSGDIVTVSHNHDDHNATAQVEGNPFIVQGPGEFEIKGVQIIGISSFHDEKLGKERGNNVIYRIEMDNLSLVHLGDLGHTLSSDTIDMMDGVDILFIPIGGFYTIDSTQAENIISEIEPSIVIPMHYNRPEINQKVFGNLSDYKVFLKEIGKEESVPQPKLSITKDKLPPEMQVVILE